MVTFVTTFLRNLQFEWPEATYAGYLLISMDGR